MIYRTFAPPMPHFRITRDSYIGGLPFRVEGSPLSSIAANGS